MTFSEQDHQLTHRDIPYRLQRPPNHYTSYRIPPISYDPSRRNKKALYTLNSQSTHPVITQDDWSPQLSFTSAGPKNSSCDTTSSRISHYIELTCISCGKASVEQDDQRCSITDSTICVVGSSITPIIFHPPRRLARLFNTSVLRPVIHSADIRRSHHHRRIIATINRDWTREQRGSIIPWKLLTGPIRIRTPLIPIPFPTDLSTQRSCDGVCWAQVVFVSSEGAWVGHTEPDR